MPEISRLPEENPETRPQQPSLPPELPDEEATRLQGDLSRTKGMQPVNPTPPSRPVPPPSQAPTRRPPAPPPSGNFRPVASVEKPKRGQTAPPPPRPQRRALYLPVWSVALTLMLVCGAVSCVVLGVVSLGGRTVAAGAPRFVIVTAEVPTSTPFVPDSLAPSPIPNQLTQGGAVPAFSLQGPTLAPIEISPTPESVAIGKTVIASAEDSGVNVRSGPSVQNERLFVADNGESFTVIDGPTQGDGLTWWKIQSPNDASRSGWAAAAYLELPSAMTQVP
ncbi:MAG: SH3 domain-containing protein [Chloroflexota bacterium]